MGMESHCRLKYVFKIKYQLLLGIYIHGEFIFNDKLFYSIIMYKAIEIYFAIEDDI